MQRPHGVMVGGRGGSVPLLEEGAAGAGAGAGAGVGGGVVVAGVVVLGGCVGVS